MGPRYHLSFYAFTTAWLAPDIHVCMCPSPLSLVFPPKTATFGAELQVSMGTRIHLPFCGCKKAWLASALLARWVPALICGFWKQNSDFWTRITSLYGSQTQPVIFCMENSVISTWNTRPNSRCFTCKNHRWGLAPIETSNSDANNAGLHSQNDRWGLGPIETCNSAPKVTVLNAKTTDEGWDPWRQVILVLITL